MLALIAGVVVVVFNMMGNPSTPRGSTADAEAQAVETSPKDAWKSAICWAVTVQVLMLDDLSDFTGAAERLDVKGAHEAAGALTTDLHMLKGALDDVPDWAPGRSVVSWMRQYTDQYLLALKDIQQGLEQLDPGILERGGERMQRGNAMVREASGLLTTLQSSHGVTCA